MEKMDEEILKYLSEHLSDDEKADFEKRLISFPLLQERLNLVKERIAEFSTVREIKLNETYFNNLLPKLHERLARNRKVKIIREYALILPTIIVVLFITFYSIFNRNGDNDILKSLSTEVINNIDDDEFAENLIKDYSIESELNLSAANGDLEVYIPENINLSLNSIYNYVDFSKLDYSQFENISVAESEKLYNNLITIKFEKVSK
ncbi:MAG: hypothetical protein AB1432_05095 [Bacteroidota bacterium]